MRPIEVTVLQYLCTFLNVDFFWILVCCVIWGLEVPWQPRIRIASFTKGDRWSKNNPSKTCRFIKRLNFFFTKYFWTLFAYTYKSPNIITCRIEKLDFIILWTNLVRRGICCIILLVIVYTVVNFDFKKLPFYFTQKKTFYLIVYLSSKRLT